MTPRQFEAALAELGWNYETAATELGVSGRGRIGDWATGFRRVPEYIAASIEARLELKECRERLAKEEEVEDG